MPLVSIIIVTYNSSLEIIDCINSIIPQLDNFNAELIIIDNNSSDETVSILGNIKEDNIHIYYNRENVGYTAGNNQGIEYSKGKYVFLLNPDTIVSKESINNLVSIAEKNDLPVVAPQLLFPDGRVQKSCRRFPRRRDVIYTMLALGRIFPDSKEINHWKMADFDHNEKRLVDQPASSAILIRNDVLNNIDNLDENFPFFFTDVDLCKRIWDSGYKIQFDPSVQITHIGGASYNRIKSKMIVISHTSFYRYFKKHNNGIINSILNYLIGGLLILMIPVRILVNLLLPSLKFRKKDSL